MGESLTVTSSSSALLKAGRSLVPKLAIGLKTSKLYDTANVNVREAAQELVDTVRTVHRMEGRAQLALILDFLTLNDIRLKTDISGYTTFRYLIESLQSLSLGSISFDFHVTADDFVQFCRVFHGVSPDSTDPFAELVSGLYKANVDTITLEVLDNLSRLEDDGLITELKQRSIKTFFSSIKIAREILTITDPRKIKFRKAKRVMQRMVDLITEDESVLLSLTSIKNYDEYTFNHSANVAVYSIAFGQKLGLEKRALSDLGMSGLLHDIGKIRVPKELLNKPARLSGDEWKLMQSHPVYGEEILLRSRELTDATIRNIMVAFEHPLNLDLGGYPNLTDRRELNLFSKLVAIADCFDALTTPRSYRNVHYSAQEALSIMMEGRGTLFDPTLLKIFVSAIGVYPIGTVVELETGETAVVVRTSENTEEIDLPVVRVIADDQGNSLPERIIDLAAEDGDGEPVHRIVRTMDPGDYFDSIEDYLEVI